MFPIKESIAGHSVATSYLLKQVVKMSRYGSLININPSVRKYYVGNLEKEWSRACWLNFVTFLAIKFGAGKIRPLAFTREVDVNKRTVTTHSYSLL